MLVPCKPCQPLPTQVSANHKIYFVKIHKVSHMTIASDIVLNDSCNSIVEPLKKKIKKKITRLDKLKQNILHSKRASIIQKLNNLYASSFSHNELRQKHTICSPSSFSKGPTHSNVVASHSKDQRNNNEPHNAIPNKIYTQQLQHIFVLSYS